MATAPTLYEWAGGAAAFDRLTEVFYRHVHADPVLSPVFAHVGPEHAHNVALWLGEVCGGPPAYTDEHGGYPAMLRHHIGLSITPEQRARWAALIADAADEAGLPDDPEVGVRGLRRVGLTHRHGELATGYDPAGGRTRAPLGLG